MINLSEVAKKFDSRAAVDNLSLDAHPGSSQSVRKPSHLVRPMNMNNNTPAAPKARVALIAAVSLVAICLALVAAVRVTDESALAAPYEYSPQANSIPHSSAVGEASAPAAARDTPISVAATEDVNTSGPLTIMQTRLAGNESDGETLFCFAETGAAIVPIDDPTPGLAVVQLSVMFNGSYRFLALQNGQYLMFAAGGGSSDGMFETTPFGISDLSTVLPPYLVTLTDTSISFGQESTLPLVSCTDVEAQIQIMLTKVAQAEAAGRFEIPRAETPDEGPLSALQASLDSQRLGSDAYCFTAQDVQIIPAENLFPARAILQLAIDAEGGVSLLGMQNHGFVISGEGPGSANGRFSVDVTGHGSTISNAQPPAEITLTDDSIAVGNARLEMVPCSEIATLIQAASTRLGSEPGYDAPAAEAESAPISNDQVLSSAGLGPIRIGMLVSELETHLGFEIDFITIDGDLSVRGDCGLVQSTLDLDVYVLVELTGDDDAIVRRISTRSDRWSTPSGIRVGMTQPQVIEAFQGQLDIQPHVYVADGQYLTFIPSDPTDPNTVEFVIEFGVVVEMRAGAHRWVSLAESCA